MKRLASTLGLLVIAGGVFTAAGCGRPSAAETPSAPAADSENGKPLDRVTAGKPVRKTLKLYTSQPGRVEAFEETPLYPKITGYVDEIKLDIGDSVKKDDVLATLWVPELKDDVKQKEALVVQAGAEVKQAEAAVHAAQAGIATAEAQVSLAEAGVIRAEADFQRWQSEHGRIKDLTARGSLTQKLADEAMNQLRSAEAARDETTASVRSAEAALKQAQANVQKADADKVAAEARLQVAEADLSRAQTMLNYTQIKSPFDGIITRRNVDTRHYVHPAGGGVSEPLFVVAQTKKVRIFVDIPELEAPLVDAGEKADAVVIRVPSLAGREFDAKVTRTSWSLDNMNRSLRTEIDIDNEQGVLRPGMYITAEILLEQREDVLTLPISAIVREGREAFCCIVNAGKIRRTPVKLGLRSGSDVEILEGLNENENVVLARADSLQDGQPVEVIATEK